jgi:hypothetical protein
MSKAARCCLIAATFLLGTAQSGFAQSQTGSNFGTPYSGSAASRSNGGGSSYVHVRRRSNDSDDQSSSRGSNGGGREIDARDAEGSAPVARQASTPR